MKRRDLDSVRASSLDNGRLLRYVIRSRGPREPPGPMTTRATPASPEVLHWRRLSDCRQWWAAAATGLRDRPVSRPG